MSVWIFGPFFDWVIYFSGIELQELLVVEINPLSVSSFAIIKTGLLIWSQDAVCQQHLEDYARQKCHILEVLKET